jgi:RimJ/RimL family protein N-acetyltransferase
MIDHGVLAGVAEERSRALRAQAVEFRQVRLARSARAARRGAAGWRLLSWRRRSSRPVQLEPVVSTRQQVGRSVVLRDGSQVLIRPVEPADAALLADGFSRLSVQSRRHRFLGVKTSLSPAELRYFTQLDHDNHEALGALDPANGHGVGIARYTRHVDRPQAADVAVTVVDDWHRRGLGTELVTQLAERARRAGIRCFTAQVAADNTAIVGLMQALGVAADPDQRDDDTVEYTIPLADAGRQAVDCGAATTG